jgi:preprotein translocase subunit SecD
LREAGGFIANVALFLNILLLMGTLAAFGATLTLPGIAGILLTAGMAVDANILIFERVREEIRSGKEVSRALEDGFDRAWLSIRDSNVSSLITCTILYAFGTPSIRGFAVTLAIGIIISMFTAISVTRTFLRLFVTGKALQRTWLFGVKAAGEGR